MDQNSLKSEVLSVAETDAGVYFLRIDYTEGNIADAVGHVFYIRGSREDQDPAAPVLSTNETLRTMWASPTGSLWVASSNGSVGTTAQVKWPAPTSGAGYRSIVDALVWQGTDLPRVATTGLRPNVTALWGTADTDVFAGTYGGHIYHWDGSVWTQVFEGPGQGAGTIRAFAGAPSDVYALGQDATLLHFDGRAWARIAVPGPSNGHETFVGGLRDRDGVMLIAGSGDGGRILSGTAAGGFSEIARTELDIVDVASLGDRVLLAVSTGVAELVGHDVSLIKSTFATVSVTAGRDRLFFIEPAQEFPGYIEYDPKQADDPWWGVEF